MQKPTKAIQPENLWWKVLKTGEFTPGNGDGKSVKFDNDKLNKIIENTKQHITENNYPAINIDHIKQGEAHGQLEDIRLNDDFLEVKVGYLTPSINDDLKTGKYPSRSVEIINDTLTGLALLGAGYPAVQGLGNTDFDFSMNYSENDNDKIYITFNEEAIMPKDKLIDKKNDIVENTETLNFKETEEYKEFLELKKNNTKLEKENTELKASNQDTRHEFKAFQTQMTALQSENDKIKKSLKLKEFEQFAEKNKIIGFSDFQVAHYLFSIENGSNEILEFNQGEGKENIKISPLEFTKNLIIKQANFIKSMGTDEIILNEESSIGKLPYSFKIGDNGMVDNSNKVNDFVKKYATENNLDFSEAYTKCDALNLI